MRRIVITLPAHNEAKTIGNVLQAIFRTMQNYVDADWHVVVVDDCSLDNSATIAEENGAKVIRLSQKAGLAAVFRREMKVALELNADWIVHIDSDGQHQAQDIPRLLNQLEQGADLVIGSRFLLSAPNSKPLIEQFESRSFSRLISWITGQTFTDVHSGFRAFTTQVAQNVPIFSTFSYAREQLFRASCRGFTIKDVPISVAARKQGKSRLIKNRYLTMLKVTGRYCAWYWQERRSIIKVPIIIGWGLGTIALSWILRTLSQLGISISQPANNSLRSQNSLKPKFSLAAITNKLEIPDGSNNHWKHARIWDRWKEENRPGVGSTYQDQRKKVIDYIASLNAPSTLPQTSPATDLERGPLKVLELCCGTGRLARDLLDNNNINRLYTVDISTQAINILQQHLKTHPRAETLQAGVANVLKFVTWPPANQFDVIICIDALPNISWSELPHLLQHIDRLLKPNGRFIGNYLSSETINAHTTRKHGVIGRYKIYSRLMTGKLLKRTNPSLAGKKGLLRTGTIYKKDLTDLLEAHFTIDRIESGIYHWFATIPKE